MKTTTQLNITGHSNRRGRMKRLLETVVIVGALCLAHVGLCQTTITCGQTVTGTTTNKGEVVTYSYTGTAGQNLSFVLAAGINASDWMVADVYDPAGHGLMTLDGGSGGVGHATNVVLAASGTYLIQVHENYYRATGTYNLTIQSFTEGGCDATSIACGQTVSRATTNEAQVVAYSYIGTAGQTLAFALAGGINGADWMVADIYDPAGQLLATLDGGSGRVGHATNLVLTASGTFTILVHESLYRATTTYYLGIQSFTGGGCDATSIGCGQTVSRATTNEAQVVAYSYIGTAGQTLAFALAGGINGADWMVADIYDPAGQLLATLDGGSGRVGHATNLVLTASGTFTILVHESLYRATTTYYLSIQSFTGGGCSGITIPCGQTLSGTISAASEMDAYELPVAAAEHVVLTAAGFSGMTLNIYDANGSKVMTMGGTTTTNYTFAVAGIYTLLVHASNYFSTGAYALTLTVFGGCPALSVTPSGDLVSSGCQGGPFAPASQTYAIANAGAGTLSWTASVDQPWVGVSPASGTDAGTVTVSINAKADSLMAGTNTATVTFGGNGGSATRSVQLSVSPAPQLSVSAEMPYVSSTTLGTPRNDYSGYVGMEIVVGQNPITVTALGRMMVGGNTGTHIVKLVQASDGTDMPGGAVSIGTSGGTAGQFQYGSLANKVVLAAGATYYLVSQETAGGDFWYNDDTRLTTSGVAADTAAVYGSGPGGWSSAQAPETSYVPVDFLYQASPPSDLSASGPQGGPFSPAKVSYGVNNSGGCSLDWTASADADWVSVSPASGTGSGTVMVSISSKADSLVPGTYLSTLTFGGNGGSLTRPVQLTVNAGSLVPHLSVTPLEGLAASGCQGGPFVPAGQTYAIANAGGGTLNWTASVDQPWVNVSPASGTDGGTVTASINAQADSLPAGTNIATVTLGGNGGTMTRSVRLVVSPPPQLMVSAPEAAYVSSTALGTPRNDYSGYVGMGILVGSNPITVTALGRMMAGGNTGTHLVKLVQASDGSDVPGGAVSIGMNGGTAGQFQYGSLASNVVLAAGATYYLVSQETAGGDYWYNIDTRVTTNGVASDTSAVYGSGPGSWSSAGAPGTSYVPVDFLYQASPPSDLSASGPQGGPFSPAKAFYRVSNGGGCSLDWTASADANWVSVSLASGTGSGRVMVSINPNGDSLLAGTYLSTLTFGGSGGSLTRPVQLTVNPTNAPRQLEIVSTNTSVGGLFDMPVELVAQGDESAAGFSVTFDPVLLAFTGARLGADSATLSLNVNTNDIGLGEIGILIGSPGGQTWAAGARQLVVLSFQASTALTQDTNTTVGFGDQPVFREFSSAQAQPLPITYVPGTVSIQAEGYEGDVAPRPSGDGRLTAIDWVQEGRFVAGLDTPANGSEFMRADCAPAPCGDGRLTTIDWIEVGRLVAGFDPLTHACGPAGPSSFPGLSGQSGSVDGQSPKDVQQRILSVSDAAIPVGQTGEVTVQAQAQGDESAYGFSLTFDPSQLQFINAGPGANALAATLNVNTNLVAAGKLGVLLGLPAGQTFSTGLVELVRVTFRVVGVPGQTNVAFGDEPVTREVSDSTATVLPASYQAGTVYTRLQLRTLGFANGTFHMEVLGAAGPGTLVIETSSDLRTWREVFRTNSVPAGAVRFADPMPLNQGQRFYRAYTQ